MTDREELVRYLEELVGKEGCGVSCEQADIFKDADGWKLKMEGFMGPWRLGESVDDAKTRLKEYASQGFGIA